MPYIKRDESFFYSHLHESKTVRVMIETASYLYHSNHAVIGNGIRADGEVSRWVSAYDPVDGVPVRRVWLVCIDNCQVRHHEIHSVFGDLTGKL